MEAVTWFDERRSAGWPLQRAAGQYVQMKMKNRLTGAFAVVDDQPEGLAIARICGNPSGHEHEMPESLAIAVLVRVNQARYGLLRDDQDVQRCLRIQVMKRERPVVLVDDVCFDFPVDYFLENSICHGKNGVGK